MGVSGLLKALGDVQREIHISEYSGTCVGLDAYCFLHKGKFACAEALLTKRPTIAYIKPLLEVVNLLRTHGVEPFAVFDGGPLPAKQEAEVARRRAREVAQWRAGALLRTGRGGTQQQATRLLGSAVDVTPEMASQCVKQLCAMGVSCIVAPCEADAQLAHLAISGRIHACITEDVDLLAFGCQRVLFGLDAQGRGREIRLADVARSRGLAPYRPIPEALPDLCVLSGCDYLPGIPRVGVKTAATLLHRSGGNVARALLLAQRDGFAVPASYQQQLIEARLAYISQTIFDPVGGCLRPLRPVPMGVQIRPGRLGPSGDAVPNEVARAVADGRVHPVTFEPFDLAVGTFCAKPAIDCETSGVDTACDAQSHCAVANAWQQFRPPRLAANPDESSTQAAVGMMSLSTPERMVPCVIGGTLTETTWQQLQQARSLGPLETGIATVEVASESPTMPSFKVPGSALVPFRSPRLRTGSASPSDHEVGGLAKRRRLGCRVACR